MTEATLPYGVEWCPVGEKMIELREVKFGSLQPSLWNLSGANYLFYSIRYKYYTIAAFPLSRAAGYLECVLPEFSGSSNTSRENEPICYLIVVCVGGRDLFLYKGKGRFEFGMVEHLL